MLDLKQEDKNNLRNLSEDMGYLVRRTKKKNDVCGNPQFIKKIKEGLKENITKIMRRDSDEER